ncbi:hypothetical protein [Streptomyces xylophagus]|uniref:hypothetical protein n=1 Tax=Streptomyces xylophagus TaxID=285514 RepID=UPI0005BC4451|nr:hypothetical protein [Streptomyces xylophagus]
MSAFNMSRRKLLTHSSALIGASLLASLPGSTLLTSPAYAADSSADKTPRGEDIRKALKRYRDNQAQVFTGKPSSNGWEMEKVVDGGGTISTRPVPGTPLEGVAVRIGDVESLLIHVVQRFHYEIDQLRKGDVVGWVSPGKVRKGLAEGNQASGTAVRIRPDHYPPGVRGGFFPQQLVVLRDILAELDGTIRWGGDDRRPDESLFYIAVSPDSERLATTTRKLSRWKDTPGMGAGSPVDVLSPRRREAAKALEHRQRDSAA